MDYYKRYWTCLGIILLCYRWLVIYYFCIIHIFYSANETNSHILVIDIDKFISNLYQWFEIHCSIRDVCFSQNSIRWILIWSFIYQMEIEATWRMQFFLFMSIGLYVNEFCFKSIRKLVYFFIIFSMSKGVYLFNFLKICHKSVCQKIAFF